MDRRSFLIALPALAAAFKRIANGHNLLPNGSGVEVGTLQPIEASVAVDVGDGPIWYRATMDIDNGSVVRFFTAPMIDSEPGPPRDEDWVEIKGGDAGLVFTANESGFAFSLKDSTLISKRDFSSFSVGPPQVTDGKLFQARFYDENGIVAFDGNFMEKARDHEFILTGDIDVRHQFSIDDWGIKTSEGK